MNTINKLLLVIPLFAFMFSCSEDFPEKQKVLDTTKIIGKTFSTESLSLTFISKDSLTFNTKNTLYVLEGKSKYELYNDTIIIKSPYGKRLEPSETTESLFITSSVVLKMTG